MFLAIAPAQQGPVGAASRLFAVRAIAQQGPIDADSQLPAARANQQPFLPQTMAFCLIAGVPCFLR